MEGFESPCRGTGQSSVVVGFKWNHTMLPTVRPDRLEDSRTFSRSRTVLAQSNFPDHMEGAIYGARQERCLEQVIDLDPGYCF